MNDSNATIIYETHDNYGDIFVIDRQGYRVLTFDPIYEQSSMDMKKPFLIVDEYIRVMMLALALQKIQHATILGLGGGAILRAITHVLPDCKMDVIEIRQKIYEIAKDFFSISIGRNMKINLTDAMIGLAKIPNNYTDVIFADLYDAHGMCPLQIQPDFIAQCYRVLNNNGWLVVNYQHTQELNNDFKFLYKQFADIYVCAVASSNIIFAGKQPVADIQSLERSVVELQQVLEVRLIHWFRKMYRLNLHE